MVDSVPECPGVQELQKIEGFAAANLAENDAVRAVAEGCLQEIADGHCRKAVLFAASFESNEVFLRAGESRQCPRSRAPARPGE